jgi:DNA-binding beta-propeller fold protein YncE
MTVWFRRLALGASVILIAGCAGSQSTIGGSATLPQALIPTQGARLGSWMLPEAKNDDLLYVSDNSTGFVHVFSYPAGQKLGTLEVGGEPEGECVDKAGDVWITRFRTTSVIEYAHGGSTPLGSVSTYPYTPWGCSIDPTTGNLAVTNTEGSIGVYANARGNPRLYTAPPGDDYGFTFCTYDDSGSLFASAPYSSIAELPKGSSEMMNMQLDFSINAQSIQWDKRHKYLAVAGYKAKGDPTPIYHVGVSGTTGNLIGTTLLKGTKRDKVAQFWIEGPKILGTSSAFWPREHTLIEKRVDSWPYPDGGTPTRVAHVAVSPSGAPALFGVVISDAKK